jgi:hypothetical protein
MTKFVRASLLVALIFVAAPRFTLAAVIYGDIAGGNQIFSGYGMGPGGGINNYIAEGFKMSADYNLQSVDIVISNFQSQAGSDFALSIFSNGPGNVPGTDLYDLSTKVSIPTSGTPTTVNLSGTGSFLLSSGTTYWLQLYATNPSSAVGSTLQWSGAYTPTFSGFATPTGAGAIEIGQRRTFSGTTTSELRTAFQLNGVLVPEPSSVALAAIGTLALVVADARRRLR